jgi:AcrR family transcriptional regulator
MPKLWTDTIDAHRRSVANAILDAAEQVAEDHGPSGLTMLRIADAAGIGRATLYKYFGDAQEILVAWHKRHIATHLDALEQIRSQAPDPQTALEAVLRAYALMGPAHHGHAIAATLHALPHARAAQDHLARFIEDLFEDARTAGQVRTDIAAADAAIFAIAAFSFAGGVRPVDTLVTLVMDAMTPRAVNAPPKGTASTTNPQKSPKRPLRNRKVV